MIALVIWNAIVFFLYGMDKRKAKYNRRRISEKTLLLSAALMGSLGALIGMFVFRHKTKHTKFKIGVPLLLIANIAMSGVMTFFLIQNHIVRFAEPYLIRDADDAPVCDAIMILGAQVYNDNRPSAILRDRLDYGYELYTLGKANKIIVSGDHGNKDYNEVGAMKEYLVNKGVPSEDIFMDHAGFNTYDSMYRAKEIFGVKTLIIATQDFHIGRSVYIARKLGIDAYGYPCEDRYSVEANNRRESLARVKAVWDALVKRKPRYLGDTIPISGNGDLTAG
ncbi:MAG: DUF1294 domain-containing protein [Oscillospiraceae bacterium]|nr:DUF1294 domain-containing protein [Oscillospiraceae bacterium]